MFREVTKCAFPHLSSGWPSPPPFRPLPAMAAEPQKAEVIHWWTSGGEAAAVKVFADAYDKAGGQWVELGDRRRRRRGGAHGGHQSHRRRQSAHDDAVQHRQATRRTRQQQLPRQSRRRRDRRPLEGPSAEADRRRIDARRPLVCAAGQHPRRQLALLQHQGVRRRRDSRTQDLERRAGGRPEAEGQRRHPLRSRRAGLAGPSPVRRGSRRRRRLRPLSLASMARTRRRRSRAPGSSASPKCSSSWAA